jgi:hypothetical protein
VIPLLELIPVSEADTTLLALLHLVDVLLDVLQRLDDA